ncbi:DNA-binding domain-containing protein [Streptomyces brasiliscabiei]|uniref:DNA-binding domain-containing protein n=1 Tax=Streptomyces brasiliscabiei TaxID=2736302 RepID=UPI001C103E24|nr:DNA-binding domain-containing protein [Streptomyces brasiliscabiei]
MARAAAEAGVACRTAQRWAAAYGIEVLPVSPASRARRSGTAASPRNFVTWSKGLALRRPAPRLTWVHRRVAEVAKEHGWPVPSYSTVYSIVRALDPALVVLAHEGTKRYREVYHLIHRREAEAPKPSGRPTTPSATCG